MTTTVELTGVPETMLWTLHNRAVESKRKDGILRDPEGERIHAAIAYDYVRSFGKGEPSHAYRAIATDALIRDWLGQHPHGTVVALGEGLETQSRRVDNGYVRWLTVDVPEAIRVREQFLQPSDRFVHLAKSALDLTWMDAVRDPEDGVLVVAQGLFMYFEPEKVRELFVVMIDRFSGLEIVFDTIPPWFSRMTLKGMKRTKHYQVPPMPWGIPLNAIGDTVRSWSPRVTYVDANPYRMPRGISGLLTRAFANVRPVRNLAPGIVHVVTS